MIRDRSLGVFTAEYRDRAVEDRFRRWRYRDSLLGIRIVSLIALLAAIPFISALYVRFGFSAEFQTIASLRIAALLFPLAVLYATFAKWSYRALDWLVLGAVLVTFGQVVALSTLTVGEVRLLELQYILVILIVYLFVPNRFLFNAIPCIGLSIIFLLDVSLQAEKLASEQIGLIVWIVLANLLGIFSAQRTERLRRSEFATRQKETIAKARLADAKEEAETANRTKSAFLANMSHELRTPLNAINGFSEMMLHSVFGPLGDSRYKGYVQDINASGRHLLSLIDEILDLSKIEAGKRDLEESRISTRDLVTDCFRVITPMARDRNVTLSENVPADLPDLWVDEVALRQVLINLTVNGVKYSEDEGHVDVSASVTGDGDVRIDVRDQGIGIRQKDLEKVTAPFVRVDDPNARSQEGTGLGLSIAKAFIELHNGTLEIDSIFGRGTTVSIILPSDRTIPIRQRLSA